MIKGRLQIAAGALLLRDMQKNTNFFCPLLDISVSGSPIIQDGKLIGAVTHVLVNDLTTGYGSLLRICWVRRHKRRKADVLQRHPLLWFVLIMGFFALSVFIEILSQSFLREGNYANQRNH